MWLVLFTVFRPVFAITYAGYNSVTGKIEFINMYTKTMPSGVDVKIKHQFLILNNNIVKGTILDCFVYNEDYDTIAIFKLPITQNGVYPNFPKLEFKSETHLFMMGNGIMKSPADVISAATYGEHTFKADEFTGTLLNTPANLYEFSTSFTFLDPNNQLLDASPMGSSFMVVFYCLSNTVQISKCSFYFKTGSFKAGTLTGTLKNGYPVFDQDPQIPKVNALDVVIGDFSVSIRNIDQNDINQPKTKYTQATLLFTNNHSIPQDVVVKLIEGSNTYEAKRVDEFNYLMQGDFKAPVGSYMLKIIQGGQSLIDMPINYLNLYKIKGPYYFNQIFLNEVFKPYQPNPPTPPTPAEESVLLIFKKKNTGKKAEEICTLSMLNVSVNSVPVFSEETTNCTIDVKIDKSKVVQGFDLEWVWTQEGATISEGKQKLTARVVSDALSAEGFELTSKFMNQSYTTNGEVAAIVVGSVAAAFMVGIIISCIFTNCKCFKAPKFQGNVYQM